MYHLAIVDDDVFFCKEFCKYLENTADILHIEIQQSIWNCAEDLYESLKNGDRQDIIFLDIELIKNNGIWLGNMIRKELNDFKTAIVYISHEKNYALQLFETLPLDFLVKPVKKEDVLRIMRRYLDINKNKYIHFIYQKAHKRCSILYENILYFRSIGRKIEIASWNENIDFYGKLGDILKQVPKDFIQIHKSYLVNKTYIREYSYEYIIMYNGERLSISKPFRNHVQDLLIEKEREICGETNIDWN